ncbi:hypothetical protein LSH36_242g00015 [Paralvinella palmiformis]|uniref:Gamma-aminobutyric acid receptor alpha-like n=1 Tax=Paralvinella palmiformis TaxID=53620 RepID=A0AAD9JMS8_9ANNE|nr:hypothetical protein LSH36_242g00015 [Paralvinella palmiformis]
MPIFHNIYGNVPVKNTEFSNGPLFVISILCTTTPSTQLSSKFYKDKFYNASFLLDTLLRDYDKRLRPGFGGEPLVVDVNINIRSMGPISEKDMAYQMDCYFRQSWVDHRLEFHGNGTPNVLPVSIRILDRLWKPDTNFYNGKNSYLHTVTSPNKLLRINQNGRILYSMRITIKASCPMYLEKFPMDIQTCPLKFGSHGYSVPDVVYKWTYGTNKSIKIASDMTLSQFDLISFPHHNTTFYQHNIGLFSVLTVDFILRRHMGYFLINLYVPCSLLVVLSWVAFWINREATSDRISLGITTVLTMCFMTIDNRRDIPKVSYSTALDYFVATCFTFVMATIIQFAGVHYFTKRGSGEIIHDSDSEDELQKSHIITDTCKSSSNNKPDNDLNNMSDASIENKSDKEHCLIQFVYCLLGSSSYRLRRQRLIGDKRFNSCSSSGTKSGFRFYTTFYSYFGNIMSVDRMKRMTLCHPWGNKLWPKWPPSRYKVSQYMFVWPGKLLRCITTLVVY